MIKIILPTLNEEEGLPLVIDGFVKQGIKDLIVVDGRSKDRTLDIAKNSGAEIIIQEGKGKGMAFQTFLRKYPINDDDFYIMLDSDNSYDPKDVGKFSSALKDFEVVSGNRTNIRYNPDDLIHSIGNKLISLCAFFLYFKWNPDICTGYWGFRGSALKKMNLKAEGFDLEANLYCQIIKKKIRYGTVDIINSPRVGTKKLKYSDALIITKRLITERFSKD